MISAATRSYRHTRWGRSAWIGALQASVTSSAVTRATCCCATATLERSRSTISGAAALGAVGGTFLVQGFGDFSGNPNETDMLLRSDTTGSFEVYDINSNQITNAFALGTVGTDWFIVGTGNFSSNPGESDLLMRQANTGKFEVYDIANNQITNAFALGAVGLDWIVAGFGPMSGVPGESDMLLRNEKTGAQEVYDISHNQITAAASMGSVGLDWQPGGVAADPPASAANSTAQLVQAMAGFGSGAAAISNTAPSVPRHHSSRC